MYNPNNAFAVDAKCHCCRVVLCSFWLYMQLRLLHPAETPTSPFFLSCLDQNLPACFFTASFSSPPSLLTPRQRKEQFAPTLLLLLLPPFFHKWALPLFWLLHCISLSAVVTAGDKEIFPNYADSSKILSTFLSRPSVTLTLSILNGD